MINQLILGNPVFEQAIKRASPIKLTDFTIYVTSQGIGWDRISADMTPQELGVSHELFASPLMLGYALAYMMPWAMLGSL